MQRSRLPLMLLALLGGCTVGPNYGGPPAAAPHAATAGGRFVRAGEAPVDAGPPPARWWAAFGDATLDRIEAQALAANPDLAAAAARLRQARAALRQQKANLLPKADATALYAHARFPGLNLDTSGSGNGASSLDLYNVGFDASWEVDLFGGQHRAIEAARATAEAAAAGIADAQVSLTAEVAQAYLNIRDRQARLALGEGAIALQERMLALTQQRFERGTASRLDVERLGLELDNARADILPLHAELDAYRDEIATLAGAEPGALDALVGEAGAVPLPPPTVAIGDPAALLQRRPDLRQAERTLAADTAKIGQAEAARFPRLSFMGIIGVGGTQPQDLTHLDDFVALLAPQLSWSFLDFGRNAAKVRQAESVREEAEAKYRAAVLAALRDAEDALSRFRNRRITVATLARAEATAGRAADLSRQRYAAGTGTLIDLLDTQRRQIAAQQDLSVARAGLAGDFVAIQKALGLGWGADQPASPTDAGPVTPAGGRPSRR